MSATRSNRPRCECINIKHNPGRCTNTATIRCTKTGCGEALCQTCAKKHHAHGRNHQEPIADVAD